MTLLAWFILPILIFLAPGLGLLALAGQGKAWGFNQRLILASGLSVAIYPLLLLYARPVNLQFGPTAAWVTLALAAIPCIWRMLRAGGLAQLRHWRAWFGPREDWLSGVTLWSVFAITLGVRLWVVRDLPAPKWADSYQHTLIVQLLLDHGGLFSSWAPYAPMQTFTYHYAFHAVCAFLAWVTGLDATQAVIIAAQWLNALAALIVYPFTVRLTGSRWAGVISVLAAGLLSPMPMYYVNWGRYTQLTGQILLALLFLLLAHALEPGHWDWSRLALVVIVVAGLWLAHYIVMIFAALWTGAWLAVHSVSRKFTLRPWWQAGLIWLLALASIAPWLLNITVNYLPVVLQPQVKFGPEWIEAFFMFPPLWFFPISRGFYAPAYLILTATLGAAIGLWRRERGVWSLVLWGLSLLGAANLFRFNLPVVNGLVDGFSVFIAGYIPLAILTGVAASYLLSAGFVQRYRWQPALAGGLVLAAILGARQRLQVHNDDFTLVTQADLRAMGWIREHTAPEAGFLVNSFFISGSHGFVSGSDGGWWIPLLARRRINLPPANYMYERMPVEAWTEFYDLAEIEPDRVSSPEALAVLRHYHVDHVYLGPKGGRLGRFQPEDFQPPNYVRVYDQEGVVIFAIQSTSEANLP